MPGRPRNLLRIPGEYLSNSKGLLRTCRLECGDQRGRRSYDAGPIRPQAGGFSVGIKTSSAEIIAGWAEPC